MLLPIPGLSLSARFSGAYCIQVLSDTDYVVQTPDRRRKTRVCHINMLKPYHSRAVSPTVETSGCAAAAVVTPVRHEEGDGLTTRPCLNCCLKVLHTCTPKCVELVSEYPCLFGDVPSQTTVISHDIDVGKARPIKQAPYRVNPVKRELMRKECKYLLSNGLAEPSSSAWSSACLLEGKPDGTPRFITDFRKVNAATVLDSYPLPRMEDCVDTLGAARYVSKLDLLKGYWQVPLTARVSDIFFCNPRPLFAVHGDSV